MPVLTTLIFSGMLGFLEVEMTASAASVRRYGSIMVKYIDPHEEIQIVLKRIIEKPVLCAYFRSRR